jgi:hypothetical protein
MKKVCAPYKNIWSALSLTLFHNPMCECAEHIHTPGSTLPPEASVTRQSATIFKPSSEKLRNIAVHTRLIQCSSTFDTPHPRTQKSIQEPRTRHQIQVDQGELSNGRIHILSHLHVCQLCMWRYKIRDSVRGDLREALNALKPTHRSKRLPPTSVGIV